MFDENFATLAVATEDVREGVALILDAALSMYGPRHPELAGVELALGALLPMNGPSAGDVLQRAYHRAGIFDADRVHEAIEHATLAFWNQFAACFPEITTGDIDPMADHQFTEAAERVARVWLQLNA